MHRPERRQLCQRFCLLGRYRHYRPLRTIFEEAWSEIDYTVRYPRQSEDPSLQVFLGVFNRVAGLADEMGSLAIMLRTRAEEQAEKNAAADDEIKRLLSEVELKVGKEQKEALEKSINVRTAPLTLALSSRGAISALDHISASGLVHNRDGIISMSTPSQLMSVNSGLLLSPNSPLLTGAILTGNPYIAGDSLRLTSPQVNPLLMARAAPAANPLASPATEAGNTPGTRGKSALRQFKKKKRTPKKKSQT